jgi:hypothetical protein
MVLDRDVRLYTQKKTGSYNGVSFSAIESHEIGTHVFKLALSHLYGAVLWSKKGDVAVV